MALQLPQDIDPGFDQHYDDLRIVDDHGSEVPYVLDPDTPYASQTPAPLAAVTRTTYSPKTGDTTVTFDLGHPNTRVTSLHVATAQPEFSRYVSVHASDDGDFWEDAGGETIARFAFGAPSLDVTLSSTTRFVRARIANQNDPPLRTLRVTLYGPPHQLVFIARPQDTYALGFVPSIQPPAYDLDDVLNHDEPHRFLHATVAQKDLR